MKQVPWDELAEWWLSETADDPAYQAVVRPLVLSLLRPVAGSTYLDVGCGDGGLMKSISATGARSVGVDESKLLLAHAHRHGPVVRAVMPDLMWLRNDSVDGAWISLVLEHIEDHRSVFWGLARAVRMGGPLVLVINHPVFTAPGSAPIFDAEDVETLWRFGSYLATGSSTELAGGRDVVFFHRPMGELLTAAAESGWSLEEMREYGPAPSSIVEHPVMATQLHLPRLLGIRWVLT